MTGPEGAWAALSSSPGSTSDIGFALRLAHTYSVLCHFGNYLWQPVYWSAHVPGVVYFDYIDLRSNASSEKQRPN